MSATGRGLPANRGIPKILYASEITQVINGYNSDVICGKSTWSCLLWIEILRSAAGGTPIHLIPLTSHLIFAVLKTLSTVKEFTATAVPILKPGTADDS
jgi:hypothetical protein